MKHLLFLLLVLNTVACGKVSSDTWLLGADETEQEKKVRCDGDHEGFYVCLNGASSISNKALFATITTALGTALPKLVNSSSFQQQVGDAFGDANGSGIVGDLTRADYAVTITGYCDASDNALAKAPLNGASIKYNECRVKTGSDGKPELAVVAGILLHEISHNLGYTHPDTNPSHSTVPYFLGDLAEKDLQAR